VSNELFRQGGKGKGERAIVQGDDSKRSPKSSEDLQNVEVPEKEKHEGPVIGVDSYSDRFERVEPGQREYHDLESRASTAKLATHSTAAALKAEIAEIVALKPIAWDLPIWRSAQLNEAILKRLSDTVDQLKVVMRASDSLADEVKALYEAKKPVMASDAEETTEETKDE
jgi:hypothetical protein